MIVIYSHAVVLLATDKYLNFLRDTLSESAASTLTESTMKTGLSYAQGGMALEIWNVVDLISIPADAVAAGAQEFVKAALAGKSGETSIPEINDVITLYYRQLVRLGGTGAAYGHTLHNLGFSEDWNPVKPLLYGYPDLYHYIVSSNAGAAAYSNIKVGFLYVTMDSQSYYEILQAYQQVFG